MSSFDKAFDLLIEHEGGYSNHYADKGGSTMFGITQETARLNGYTGDMRDLPFKTAKAIYQEQYWHPEFEKLPFNVAFNVFDGVVNSGAVRSIKWLQSAIGVNVDGILGSNTLNAAISQNPFDTVRKYNAARLEYLTGLGNWNVFGKGWARRIAKNLMV